MDLPLETTPADAQEWIKVLDRAFRDPGSAQFLPLAERAVRDCPTDPDILRLTIIAALFDRLPERALIYLKRYAKRFVTDQVDHLLHALALGQQQKFQPAFSILQRHGLMYRVFAITAMPSEWVPTERLWKDYDRILAGKASGFRKPLPRASNGVAKTGAAVRVAPEPARATTPLPSPAAANDISPAAPSLPAMAIDIPFAAEIDLAPMLSAIQLDPERGGDWYRLRERLAHLGLAQGFDELLCLPDLRGIDTLHYQVETARKVLKQFHGRVLLADEVGLGKTIEAGIVLKEYLVRGMVESVLVLAPPSLVGQWREELQTKFDLSCLTTHDPLLRADPDRFWNEQRLIASIAMARRAEHSERLFKRTFDLVIVDEAHHLRDRASQGYKLVDKLKKRFLLLLSATPVQNDLTELYNILTLLKPGIFKTLKEFRAAHVINGKPRQPANPERLRELMRDAMIRNTRAVVALTLPARHATTIAVDGTEDERRAYCELADAVRGLAAAGASGRNRLAMHHLLGAAGSSPAAARSAVTRFTQRHEGAPIWQHVLAQWQAVGIGAKETALLELLGRNPAEKKLVFVRYRETLDHLAELLTRSGTEFARFEGGLSGIEKDAAIEDFRNHVPVLLSTESGGEGRNIQFCNTIINFDVPWNPMTIEQRIGRIDRIGQQREVFVFNLVSRGTLEERILRLLEEKISLFELVVGEVGAILGSIEEERDFSDLVLDAWLQTTESTRGQAFDEIGRRLDDARRQHEDAKTLDTALFGEDFETA
jgi:superfamily II DNA or RNA helicase